MLIIGHRGAAGLAPENTMESLQAGIDAGADMLEFDVRLTKDHRLVLAHDFHTLRTHHSASLVSQLTLTELRQRTKAAPIATLEEVLDLFFGKILLNIELKGWNTGKAVTELLEQKYMHRKKDWDTVLLTSFKAKELIAARKASPVVNLALIHDQNPFLFIAYQRKLHLTAVGFHRLYINRFALEIAKRTGLFTYVYTVDRPHAALLLQRQGIDAVVTNYPDRILNEISKGQA
jgi:glycerophosphoryl diester phosphodiesterase